MKTLLNQKLLLSIVKLKIKNYISIVAQHSIKIKIQTSHSQVYDTVTMKRLLQDYY